MKLILFSIVSLVIAFTFFACKTKKEVTQTTEEKVVSDSPFSPFCACKNSKGLTVEEYGLQESKKAGISVEEYAKNFKMTPDSWLIKEFLADAVFMETAMSTLKQLGNEGAFGNQETVDKVMEEFRTQHPICSEAFMMMITGVVGSPKE